ncbi:MAG: hypothetical protein ACRDPC_14820, partial [Solirubrobacteraceae bacterium]
AGPGPAAPSKHAAALEKATPVQTAHAHRSLKRGPGPEGKAVVDLPNGCFIIEAAEADALKPLALSRKEKYFTDFATAREPLYEAMRTAKTDAERRTAIVKLRELDAGKLPELRDVQAALGGSWDIEDDMARKAVLAAIQLEAATGAESDLLEDSKEVHKRVYTSAGMAASHDWCGFFAQDNYRTSSLDKDLRAGFFHTNNVQDFFNYVYTRNPDRIKKWIWAEEDWQELKAYHASRGAERKWLDYGELSAGGELDIQPGDTALVDVGLDGTPNHIVLVQSYDPTTSTLISVGGNDSGMVVENDPKRKLPKENAAQQEKREKLESSTGQQLKAGPAGGHVGVAAHKLTPEGKKRGAIFGVGRPSLIDFEDHIYDGTLKKKPAPLKK